VPCTRPFYVYRDADGVVHKREPQVDGKPVEGCHRLEVPCGRCPDCLTRRVLDDRTRLIHEGRLHPAACAVTLTYAPGSLPPLGSVSKRDVQGFLKRLRFALGKRGIRIRFHAVAEYSPEAKRPHYHVTLFGWFPEDARPWGKSQAGNVEYVSAELTALWSHGRVTFQPFSGSSARYVAEHQASKLKGRRGEAEAFVFDADGQAVGSRATEWRLASSRPGLGAGFLCKYWRDFMYDDACIVNGRPSPVPRYYVVLADDIVSGRRPELAAEIKDLPAFAAAFDRLKVERERKGGEAYVRSLKSHGSRKAYLSTREVVTAARHRHESAAVNRSGTERAR